MWPTSGSRRLAAPERLEPGHPGLEGGRELKEFHPDCDSLPTGFNSCSGTWVWTREGCPGGSGQDGEGGQGAARLVRRQGADQAGRGDRPGEAGDEQPRRWVAA